MIYYGPKQRGRRKTLMTAVSFSLRLAYLGAEEKKCTHTHKHTHTYTKFIYTFLYTDPHGKMYNGFFSINI